MPLLNIHLLGCNDRIFLAQVDTFSCHSLLTLWECVQRSMLEVGFQNNICDLLGGVLEYMTRPIISEACVRTMTGSGTTLPGDSTDRTWKCTMVVIYSRYIIGTRS